MLLVVEKNNKPILVYRGEIVESTHDIHIVVVSASGDIIAYYGNPDRQTFARSSMKPFQAIPVVESGAMEQFDISLQELAVFCASHSGEPIHRETVLRVLEKMDLTEEDLQCGTHIPRDVDSYHELIRKGQDLSPLYSNCSGKHAGMLAGCMKQNFDLTTYRDVDHPYQQQILEAIADVSEYKKEDIKTSVDGCGVPVHLLSLYNLALAYSRLARPDLWNTGNQLRKRSLQKIRDAMTRSPEMVAGTKRFDTDLMRTFQGRIVAKGGAEGVHCFGDTELGIGVAIKVEDGNARATTVAAMEVIKQLKIGEATIWNQLEEYHVVPILNARKEKIGKIIANFSLNFIGN